MQILKGMPVVEALTGQIKILVEKLNEKRITPKLAVVRVGEREEDTAYEKGIQKRFVSYYADFTLHRESSSVF